jgi:cell division protein FtsW
MEMDEYRSDTLLLFSIVALTLIGLVMVYSSSYSIAIESTQARDANFFFRKHLVRVMLGLLLLYIFARVGEHRLRSIALPAVLVSIGLLVLVLLPTGLRLCIRGSCRWLRIGPVSFQPSELARIGLILYLADFIARKGDRVKHFSKGFVPPFVIIASMVLLVALEPNIGTAAMLLLIGSVLLFAGGARLSHLLSGLAGSLATMLLVMRISGYNWGRLSSYLNSSGGEAISYHVKQSLIAIGAGGLGGVGIGMGNQKYLFVPDAHTDFVFAIMAEEIGFLGMLCIITLFVIFVWRGLKTARRAQTVFSSALATGITMTVAAYFCVSAAVCTGILPTAGLPLPFMSYGGTSSMILLASCGMLLGISRRRRSFMDLQPARWRDMVK